MWAQTTSRARGRMENSPNGERQTLHYGGAGGKFIPSAQGRDEIRPGRFSPSCERRDALACSSQEKPKKENHPVVQSPLLWCCRSTCKTSS